ncbi:hypothetical protein K438DRAFT_1967300 [Mycena galopus ATCC 62051]|nr:hypothetical protein K438DRAFT_1967300 [Mycena galopus ATCC 62051]
MLENAEVSEPNLVVRDTDHYHPTGDCIIQVEKIFFKIHKFLLTHNSPVFESMFGLPVGMDGAEGSSDASPIVLAGDRADDFRAVLNYLYAGPLQTQVHSITIVALAEIISVAKFAHKYEMDHWKAWALSVLGGLVVDINSVPVAHLPALYLHYHLVQEYPMRDRVMKRWREIIERDGLPIISVLDAADACQDRDAQAELYCIQIRQWEKGATMLAPKGFTQDGLAPIHVQRILSGHLSLSLSWKQFRNVPNQYPLREEQCQGPSPEDHETNCITFFEPEWTEALGEAERMYPDITQLGLRLAHAGRCMLKYVGKYQSSAGKCGDAWINRFNDHLEHNVCLTDHFFATPDP